MKKRYENLGGIIDDHGIIDFIKWMKERLGVTKDFKKSIPTAGVKDKEKVKSNRTKTAITWIGHSTFLIQTGGLNIVTDPVWANRMGALKRLTKPGYELSDMPEIDAVLISHGHYDHLDFPSIKRLKGNPACYVPVGLKRKFLKRGFTNVFEANWWDTFKCRGVKLSFVPAQHWTRRLPWDTNTSHWGGWVIENGKENIYFAGDTGYFDTFKQIGEKFNIKTAIMPIGAYEPEWMMKMSHINPEDAIKAFLDMRADTFVPMHYGTYRLTDDTGIEAITRLLKEWNSQSLDPAKLSSLALGETLWQK